MIAVCLVLIVAAIIIAPMVIDPNDFKPQIQAAVKKQTGRELLIDGELELSVFPWIGLSTGQLELSNAKGFEAQHFAKIDSSHIKVKVLPLLSKKVEISRIELLGLDLRLAKNGQGVSNWDDLTKRSEPSENKTQEVSKNKDNSVPLAALALGGLLLEDAHVVWNDQHQDQYIEISDLNLTTGKLEFNRPVDVNLSLKLINKKPELTGEFGFSTALIVNEQLNLIQLSQLQLDTTASGEGVPGGKVITALKTHEIKLDLSNQKININNLRFDLDELTDQKLMVHIGTHADIDMATQSVVTSDFKLSAENLLQKQLRADATADLSVNLSEQTLAVSGLNLEADALKLTADLKGTEIKDNPSISGSIHLASFNLAQLLKKLDVSLPPMKASDALNRLEVGFGLKAGKDSARIDDLKINLDDSQISGVLQLKNFAKPASTFDIHVDKIDVGRYLPPESSKKPESKKIATPAGAAVAAAELFPVNTLRQVNSSGKLTIDQLKKDDLSMQGLSLILDAKKGLIKTQQRIKKLYQGDYLGNASINVKNQIPVVSLNEKLSNIQIEPLMQALKIDTKMSGLVNASAKLEGKGNSTDAIKSTLNGDLSFNFADSVIKGFNLQKIIDSSRLLIEGRSLPAKNKNDQTVFKVIKGTAKINQGVLTNNDLLAESSKVKVAGKGSVNLVNETINYGIDARLLNPETQRGFKGLPVVIKVGGTFTNPSYTPDVETMLKAKYQDKINKKVEKEKEKIIKKLDEKLGPGVGNVLKGLF